MGRPYCITPTWQQGACQRGLDGPKRRVAQFATPREIYQRPVSQYVACFTGEACQIPVHVIAAAGADQYRATLAGVEIILSGPAGVVPGSTQALMVRPEAVAFADTGVPGTVQTASFLGAVQHCAVAVGMATVSVLAEANRRIAPGDAVHLRIDPALGWLLREGAA